jgi:hypothetical protein
MRDTAVAFNLNEALWTFEQIRIRVRSISSVVFENAVGRKTLQCIFCLLLRADEACMCTITRMLIKIYYHPEDVWLISCYGVS